MLALIFFFLFSDAPSPQNRSSLSYDLGSEAHHDKQCSRLFAQTGRAEQYRYVAQPLETSSFATAPVHNRQTARREYGCSR